jgi:hypothetical protein
MERQTTTNGASKMNKELKSMIEATGNTVESFIANIVDVINNSGINLKEFNEAQQQKIICMYAAVALRDNS